MTIDIFLMHPALVISTIPHYFILFIPLNCNGLLFQVYPWTITISTTLSILWHLDGQRPRFYYLDYFFAGLWTAHDLTLAVIKQDIHVFISICYINMGLLLLNKAIDATKTSYVWNHSLWHLLNAAKCMTTATALQCIQI
jgi:hypothetical protein